MRAFEKAGFWVAKSRGKKHIGMTDGKRRLTIPRHPRINPYTLRTTSTNKLFSCCAQIFSKKASPQFPRSRSVSGDPRVLGDCGERRISEARKISMSVCGSDDGHRAGNTLIPRHGTLFALRRPRNGNFDSRTGDGGVQQNGSVSRTREGHIRPEARRLAPR
ncbi:MAG: type II toxin-antitoxin system HicA family toxin [Candidatus Liptonbacteria bacterium]|nr:type II toxin-antitoxin system HicA family toxin [Candidatus Liptonbacteria bacterium]